MYEIFALKMMWSHDSHEIVFAFNMMVYFSLRCIDMMMNLCDVIVFTYYMKLKVNKYILVKKY